MESELATTQFNHRDIIHSQTDCQSLEIQQNVHKDDTTSNEVNCESQQETQSIILHRLSFDSDDQTYSKVKRQTNNPKITIMDIDSNSKIYCDNIQKIGNSIHPSKLYKISRPEINLDNQGLRPLTSTNWTSMPELGTTLASEKVHAKRNSKHYATPYSDCKPDKCDQMKATLSPFEDRSLGIANTRTHVVFPQPGDTMYFQDGVFPRVCSCPACSKWLKSQHDLDSKNTSCLPANFNLCYIIALSILLTAIFSAVVASITIKYLL